MIDCPIYLTVPGDAPTPNPSVDDAVTCTGCNCGYLQYEDLLPYLSEIKSKLNQDSEDYTQLEYRLRQQILEISRLFDHEAGVKPGYFSKGHFKTTKVFTTNDGRYIKIPEFIEDTLEVRTLEDIVVNTSTYGFENQHLIYLPCYKHRICGCPMSCHTRRCRRPLMWPHKCYKISARWGKSCADIAVKMAVRDYLIETYRLQDPIRMLATGIPFQAKFQVPYSWTSFMMNFKQRNKFFSQFAIA